MALFGKGLRGKQLDELEKEALGESKAAPAKKAAVAPKKERRTMTQSEFFGSGKTEVEKKARGGIVSRRGYGAARGGCK